MNTEREEAMRLLQEHAQKLDAVERLARQSAPQVDKTRELQAMAVDKRSDLQALLKIADHLDSLVEWTIGNSGPDPEPPGPRTEKDNEIGMMAHELRQIAQSAPQQEPVAWIADIAGYADHRKVRCIVFSKDELTYIKDGVTVWTPVYATPPAEPDVVRVAMPCHKHQGASFTFQTSAPSAVSYCPACEADAALQQSAQE